MQPMAVETRPDPDALLAQRPGRGGARAARPAADLLRRHRRRRQDLRDARGRARRAAPTASTSSSATSSRTAASRPSGCSRASSGCRRCRSRYRGIVRQEFDLDAALARRPAILLVDELAHTNLVGGEPPPRHPKRWQDVEELLDAGIDVWTTLNVQHLESLNDVVAQITGVRQRETVPDRVFDEADEVELIDLPPDELLERLQRRQGLRAGAGGTARRALLPQAEPDRAARARAAAHDRPRRGRGARVAGRRPDVARLAGARAAARRDRPRRAGRAARARRQAHGRRAARANGPWCTSRRRRCCGLSEKERDRRIDLLRLAESLGAETVTLDGPTAGATRSLEYAQHAQRDARASSARRSAAAGARCCGRSAATELARRARRLRRRDDRADRARRHADARGPARCRRRPRAAPFRWKRYVAAAAITAACTAVAWRCSRTSSCRTS